MNNRYSKPIDISPHEYLFGFKIPGPTQRLLRSNNDKGVDIDKLQFLQEHLRQDAQLAIGVAAAVEKRHYNSKHRRVKFDVGNKVFLELGKAYRPEGQQNTKITPRQQGAYKITKKISPLAYELDVPQHKKIHPVVSVQYLSRYPNDLFKREERKPSPVQYGDKPNDLELGPRYKVQHVVQHRDGKNGVHWYRIH